MDDMGMNEWMNEWLVESDLWVLLKETEREEENILTFRLASTHVFNCLASFMNNSSFLKGSWRNQTCPRRFVDFLSCLPPVSIILKRKDCQILETFQGNA